MITLSTLIDSLLASAHTGPRADVASIKPEARIGAPEPVQATPRTANEVRLPSRAALERLAGGMDAPALRPGAAGRPSDAGTASELSAAARLVSTVLAQVRGDAGPVRGAAPLWTAPSALPAAALAGALAQTVDTSGLFYESHLAQWMSGARSLPQLQAEPQARWPQPAPASAPGAAPGPQAQAASLYIQAPPAPAAPLVYVQPQPGQPMLPAGDVPPPQPEGSSPSAAPAGAPSSAREPSPAAAAEARTAASAAPAHGAAPALQAHAAAADASLAPQALTLVHQQLDLLATSVFRWSGQAWPGVPMDWAIHEEEEKKKKEDASPGGADAAAQRRWVTTLSMQLPRLGVLDIRLALSGDSVQASLAAREAQAAVRLAGEGPALAGRLEAAGLQLAGLQVREAMEAAR